MLHSKKGEKKKSGDQYGHKVHVDSASRKTQTKVVVAQHL